MMKKDFFHESFANSICKDYRFEHLKSIDIKEELFESKFSFNIVLKLMKLWIKGEILKQDMLLNLLNISCGTCKETLKNHIDASRFAENLYMKNYLAIKNKLKSGPWYKKSVQRDCTPLHGLPVNLHLQRMSIVSYDSSKAPPPGGTQVGSDLWARNNLGTPSPARRKSTRKDRCYRTLSASNFEIAAFASVNRSARYRKSSEAEFVKWGEERRVGVLANDDIPDDQFSSGIDGDDLVGGGNLSRKKSLSTSDLFDAMEPSAAPAEVPDRVSNLPSSRESGTGRSTVLPFDTVTVGAFSVSGSNFLRDIFGGDHAQAAPFWYAGVDKKLAKVVGGGGNILGDICRAFKKFSATLSLVPESSRASTGDESAIKGPAYINATGSLLIKRFSEPECRLKASDASLIFGLPPQPLYISVEDDHSYKIDVRQIGLLGVGQNGTDSVPVRSLDESLDASLYDNFSRHLGPYALLRFDHVTHELRASCRALLDATSSSFADPAAPKKGGEGAQESAIALCLSRFTKVLTLASGLTADVIVNCEAFDRASEARNVGKARGITSATYHFSHDGSKKSCGTGVHLKPVSDECRSLLLELNASCHTFQAKGEVVRQATALDPTPNDRTEYPPPVMRVVLTDLRARVEECRDRIIEPLVRSLPLLIVHLDLKVSQRVHHTHESVLQSALESYKRNVAQSQALASLSTAMVPDLNTLLSRYLESGRADDELTTEPGIRLSMFVSLLSCYKEEKVMIGDMGRAIDQLDSTHFRCWGVRPDPGTRTPVYGDVARFDRYEVETGFTEDGSWLISIYLYLTPGGVTATEYNDSTSLRPEQLIELSLSRVYTVFFTFGLNEQHILGKYLGDISLQHRLNAEALRRFSRYLSTYGQGLEKRARNVKTGDGGKSFSLDSAQKKVGLKEEDIGLLHHTSKQLRGLADAIESNDVAGALDIIERLTRLCNGLRFTSCKSGKDRTGMSVTLEQSEILKRTLHLTTDQFNEILENMRKFGVRRYDVFKNVGTWQYAFNKLQYCALPPLFKPPRGCFRSGQT